MVNLLTILSMKRKYLRIILNNNLFLKKINYLKKLIVIFLLFYSILLIFWTIHFMAYLLNKLDQST